ncbi:MAG: hypothetical protein ACM3S3_01110, partial [Candidatus Doudnabacteria bacterium]
MPREEIARALQLLYALLDDSDRLGLSRAARLRVVAVVGELEAATAKTSQPTAAQATSPRRPDAVPLRVAPAA